VARSGKCSCCLGIKPGMEVIDLCSGDGWFTLQIAKIAQHVTAIDIDPSLLDVARHRPAESRITNCDFVVGDALRVCDLCAAPRRAKRLRAAN
jgi:ubiquinone/menaquinone biosynthesis C-methylase UbiE